MENTSLIVASRAATLERQMQVVANNVANMNTTGFKSQSELFQAYLVHPQKEEKYNMVRDLATLRNLESGPLTQTGNALDIAIEGDGYFAVDTLDGMRYTRAGNFNLNDQRQLVNVNGLPVLDDTGRDITIPANARDIRVSPEGTISTEAGQLATIGVSRFDRQQFMTPLGNGLYQTNEQPLKDEVSTVRQGFVEGSNVKPVIEMNNMIEVNRQYQSVQKILQTEHERLRNAYQKLSKLS